MLGDAFKTPLTSTERQATMYISSSTEKYSYYSTHPQGSTTYQTLQVPVPNAILPKENPILTTNNSESDIFEERPGNSDLDQKHGLGSTEEFGIDPQVVMSPKTDYVKNVRRGNLTNFYNSQKLHFVFLEQVPTLLEKNNWTRLGPINWIELISETLLKSI